MAGKATTVAARDASTEARFIDDESRLPVLRAFGESVTGAGPHAASCDARTFSDFEWFMKSLRGEDVDWPQRPRVVSRARDRAGAFDGPLVRFDREARTPRVPLDSWKPMSKRWTTTLECRCPAIPAKRRRAMRQVQHAKRYSPRIPLCAAVTLFPRARGPRKRTDRARSIRSS